MSEAALQAACVALLHVYERQGRLAFLSIPNGACLAGDARQRAMQMFALKRTGLRPGAPDVVIILPGGKTAWAELKAGRGKLSPDQMDWAAALRAKGHPWELVRSVDDMKSFVERITTAVEPMGAA